MASLGSVSSTDSIVSVGSEVSTVPVFSQLLTSSSNSCSFSTLAIVATLTPSASLISLTPFVTLLYVLMSSESSLIITPSDVIIIISSSGDTTFIPETLPVSGEILYVEQPFPPLLCVFYTFIYYAVYQHRKNVQDKGI